MVLDHVFNHDFCVCRSYLPLNLQGIKDVPKERFSDGRLQANYIIYLNLDIDKQQERVKSFVVKHYLVNSVGII